MGVAKQRTQVVSSRHLSSAQSQDFSEPLRCIYSRGMEHTARGLDLVHEPVDLAH